MDVDNDLLSVALRTDIDFWAADKNQRFRHIDDDTPLIDGGFSSKEIARFIQSNWVLERTKKDIIEWPVGFGTEVPGEIVVKWGPIPRGTQILKNPVLNISLVPQ